MKNVKKLLLACMMLSAGSCPAIKINAVQFSPDIVENWNPLPQLPNCIAPKSQPWRPGWRTAAGVGLAAAGAAALYYWWQSTQVPGASPTGELTCLPDYGYNFLPNPNGKCWLYATQSSNVTAAESDLKAHQDATFLEWAQERIANLTHRAWLHDYNAAGKAFRHEHAQRIAAAQAAEQATKQVALRTDLHAQFTAAESARKAVNLVGDFARMREVAANTTRDAAAYAAEQARQAAAVLAESARQVAQNLEHRHWIARTAVESILSGPATVAQAPGFCPLNATAQNSTAEALCSPRFVPFNIVGKAAERALNAATTAGSTALRYGVPSLLGLQTIAATAITVKNGLAAVARTTHAVGTSIASGAQHVAAATNAAIQRALEAGHAIDAQVASTARSLFSRVSTACSNGMQHVKNAGTAVVATVSNLADAADYYKQTIPQRVGNGASRMHQYVKDAIINTTPPLAQSAALGSVIAGAAQYAAPTMPLTGTLIGAAATITAPAVVACAGTLAVRTGKKITDIAKKSAASLQPYGTALARNFHRGSIPKVCATALLGSKIIPNMVNWCASSPSLTWLSSPENLAMLQAAGNIALSAAGIPVALLASICTYRITKMLTNGILDGITVSIPSKQHLIKAFTTALVTAVGAGACCYAANGSSSPDVTCASALTGVLALGNGIRISIPHSIRGGKALAESFINGLAAAPRTLANAVQNGSPDGHMLSTSLAKTASAAVMLAALAHYPWPAETVALFNQTCTAQKIMPVVIDISRRLMRDLMLFFVAKEYAYKPGKKRLNTWLKARRARRNGESAAAQVELLELTNAAAEDFAPGAHAGTTATPPLLRTRAITGDAAHDADLATAQERRRLLAVNQYKSILNDIHDAIVTDRKRGIDNIAPYEITRIKNICNEKLVQESTELQSLRRELLGLLPAEATERPTAAATLALSAAVLQPDEPMAPQPATQAPAARSFMSMGKSFLERCKTAAVNTAAKAVQKAQDSADAARAYVLPAGFLPTNRMNFGKTLPVDTHPAAAAPQAQAKPTRRELMDAEKKRSAAMRKEERKGTKSIICT